jgi:hypothetical protein
MLKPPPDRYEFEKEIKALVPHDGDIGSLARYLQKDYSTVSRQFNPGCADRLNPLFAGTMALYAFDALRDGIGDQALAIVTRERRLWLPAPTTSTSAVKSTSHLLTEFNQLMSSELEGKSDEDQYKEADDVVRAAEAKRDEILARIEAKRL